MAVTVSPKWRFLHGLLFVATLSVCSARLDDRCIPSRTEPELRDMLISYGRHHERSDRFMRHLDRVKLLQSMPELQLVFYGDSIANRMNKLRARDWHRLYGAEFNALALGIGGDQTENVLWRITHGEFAQAQNPQFVVLMMGINNILHKFRDLDADDDDDDDSIDMPEKEAQELVDEITRHMKEIAAFIHQNSCRTQIVVQAILPSAEELPNRVPNRQTRVSDAVNESLRKLTEGYSNMHFLNCGHFLLTEDGDHIDDELMPDLLHPTNDGYTAMAPCVKENIYRITRDLLLETAHTEWGECSKRCGGGMQSEMCTFGADFHKGLRSAPVTSMILEACGEFALRTRACNQQACNAGDDGELLSDGGSTEGDGAPSDDGRPDVEEFESSEELTSSDRATNSEADFTKWEGNYSAFLDEDYEEDYTVYQPIVVRDVPRYAIFDISSVTSASAQGEPEEAVATSAAPAISAPTLFILFVICLFTCSLVSYA